MSSSEGVDESHASGESDDSDAESVEAETQNDPLRLPPSSFSMPADDADYELWTIRMPVSVDHTSLHGTKLSLDKKILGMIQSGGQKYGVTFGEAFENESFRVLVEGENKFMIPAGVPFAKHLNVAHYDAIKEISQTDLAPGVDRAPTPIDPIRKAYSVVPQKTGLKRRWMPSGVPPAATQTKKAQDFMEGLLEYHARHVHKGTMSGVTEMKDASPIKSPPPKPKRRKDLNDADDHDQLLTQENPTPTRRKIKLETVLNEKETEEKGNGSSMTLKKEPSIDDDSEAKRSAKKAKKEAKKAKKEAKKAKKEKRNSVD